MRLNTAAHQVIGRKAGLHPQSARDAFYYLLNEGLLEIQNPDGIVRITHEGVKECENLVEEYQAHSGGAMINNSLNIKGVSEPALRFEIQNLQVPGEQTLAQLKEFTGLVQEKLPELDVDEGNKSLIVTELQTMETELESAKPRKNLLVTALLNLKKALIGSFFDLGVRFLLSKLAEILRGIEKESFLS